MSPSPAKDREEGRIQVKALCEAFAAEITYYKSDEFDETTNRQRFIDPFFCALGWDVTDEERHGPRADVLLEQSVLAEKKPKGKTVDVNPDQIKLIADETLDELEVTKETDIGVSATGQELINRRPDYSFRLNGSPKFFVEAKRPSVKIESNDPIWQVKSYGWSAGVPVVLLTDFEELLAFDCRYRPEIDAPRVGLLPDFQLTFKSYVKNWDLLWDSFSRDAVLNNSLDRYVEKREGAKGQRPVDEAFLADLEGWRQELAQNLAELNPHLTVWQVNDATQLIIDRIVFVRVCEDRQIESNLILRPLLDSSDPYKEFVHRLEGLNERYNGSLLAPDFVNGLTVEPETMKRIIQGLYTPWSPYRFDALGVEILGSIYERALGSAVEMDDERKVTIELKPEVRKSGGVYYTPQWIADEMIHLTLDPLLADKTLDEIRDLKILDPACGSGSFLIRAFERMIRFYEEFFTRNPKTDPELHYRNATGTESLTEEAKAQVLTRHIFGVDVDAAAVEVTMMSLYLKSLETESPEFVREEIDRQGSILPTLTDNIKHGNSIVSTDFYGRPESFRQLSPYEEHRLQPFRWDDPDNGFGRVLSEGGFDVVIGNPPYFNVDATYGAGHPLLDYMKDAYRSVWMDKTDIYYYFLVKALDLASKRFCFIVSRALLEAEKAKETRGWLSQRCELSQLVDFEGFMVFRDAGIATAILCFQVPEESKPQNRVSKVSVRKLRGNQLDPLDVRSALHSGESPFLKFEKEVTLSRSAWHFPSPSEDPLIEEIDEQGQALGTLVDLGKGMETGANAVYQIAESDIKSLKLPSTLIKARARNSLIHRYAFDEPKDYLLYLEDVANYADLPSQVRNHLEQPSRKSKLEERAAYQRGNCSWWRYTFPLHKELYKRRHLIAPYRADGLRFAFQEEFNYLGLTDTTVVFEKDDLDENFLYLLGLLNSSLMTFRFRRMAKLTGDDMWECLPNVLEKLPIRRINFEDPAEVGHHDQIVALVKELLHLVKEMRCTASDDEVRQTAPKIDGKERALDDLVFELYGINDSRDRTLIRQSGSIRD